MMGYATKCNNELQGYRVADLNLCVKYMQKSELSHDASH